MVVSLLLVGEPLAVVSDVGSEQASSEEHLEYLLRVDLLLELTLSKPLSPLHVGLDIARLFSSQVVHLPLLGVGETRIGCTDFLEGVC